MISGVGRRGVAAWMVGCSIGIAVQAVDPMLEGLDAGRLGRVIERHAGRTALIFTESRDFPIRRLHGVPERWESQAEAQRPSFAAVARPGEFFVFQVGVYALKETDALEVRFADLSGPRGVVPVGAFRCLSLGGTNHLGRPFAKSVRVSRGNLQALWMGVDIPGDLQGDFVGSFQVTVAPGETVPVRLSLRIEGKALKDHGDSEPRNLSRLRWLDSTTGSEPTLVRPYTPVSIEERSVRVLGRELRLTEGGLPAGLRSHFSEANTRVESAGRDLLADAMTFVAEGSDGPMTWRDQFGQLEQTPLAAQWTASSEAGGLRREVTGRLDFAGSGEIRLRVTSDRDLDLEDLRLEVPFREDAATFFMGLNTPGGLRPREVHWKWDVERHQDAFWLGRVNGGLMLRFKGADYRRPAVNIYYAFRPLRLPDSWGHAGRGGIDLLPAADGRVLARATSGPRTLRRGEPLDFVFEFHLTPFRTLDTDRQWAVRFTHLGGPKREAIDGAVDGADPRHGPNVVNVHHASFYAPYINYPYSGDSFPAFGDLVRRAHERGVRLRVYYTTREITQNMPEFFPLHAFNGEILLPGPGPEARTLLHPKGPHPWLSENLREDFIPAWEAKVGPPYADLDLSVITTPDSRWNNFYLEGLRWLVERSDFDGMYVDDTALDATSLRRARRVLDTREGRLIDLHSWNHFNRWAGFANNLLLYMEVLPYLDRLWLGEGFNASQVPWDFWLVEMSGLPFGVMSEMLDGANPWRGLLFGETARHPWSGDPRGIWRVWDEFGIQGTEFLPFFAESCPVRTDHPDVKATVYRRPGRVFVAVASWAKEAVSVKLLIDWPALGLAREGTTRVAPAIPGVQAEHRWRPDEALPVAPGRGWFLVLGDE